MGGGGPSVICNPCADGLRSAAIDMRRAIVRGTGAGAGACSGDRSPSILGDVVSDGVRRGDWAGVGDPWRSKLAGGTESGDGFFFLPVDAERESAGFSVGGVRGAADGEEALRIMVARGRRSAALPRRDSVSLAEDSRMWDPKVGVPQRELVSRCSCSRSRARRARPGSSMRAALIEVA